MSYLVLARKWRPKTFAEVVGQEHVTATLRKAFEKERLAHAYLFSGPRGCGKTTTARLLAKIINCEDPQGGEPCNRCSSCLAVNDGTHLDMIEIDGASNRGIDEIRDLREKIGYASARSGSKIYIIDEVHMLTQQAFNALLKTLEEPPGHVYFVFATTEPHKVPATILSRCQRFNFKRLELSELTGQLVRICEEEGIEYDPEAVTLICRRADGSMRDAESLLDQCISASEGKIDLATVREVLGLVDSQVVTGLLDAISLHDREGALSVVDNVSASGMDLEEFFIAFLEGIRNLLVISVSKERTGWLDLTAAEIDELSSLAERFGVEDLLFLFRSMSRAFRELKTSNQQRYHIEAAVAEAASWESAVEIGELINRLEHGGGGSDRGAGGRGDPGMSGSGTGRRGEGAGAGGGEGSRGSGGSDPAWFRNAGRSDEGKGDVAAAPEEGEGDSRVGTLDSPPRENPLLEALGGKEEWERFLAQVRESKLTLGIWLMSAEVAGIEGDKLILSFTPHNRFAMGKILQEENRRLIESQLERFYGRKFTVEVCEMIGLKDQTVGPDRQAELEIAARTKVRRRGRGRASTEQKDSPGIGRVPPGEALSGSAKGAAGGSGSAGGGKGMKNIKNPALKRIMKELDAELLD